MRFLLMAWLTLFGSGLMGCSSRVNQETTQAQLELLQAKIAEQRARILELEAQLRELRSGPAHDLIALVDIPQDTVNGEWSWKDKHLLSPSTPDAKLAFPVRPTGDYQLLVQFKRPADGGGPILCLPVGNKHVNFALDAYSGAFTALEAVDGQYVNFPHNPTQITGTHLVTNQSHRLTATVLRQGAMATIQVDLDGKRLLDWTGDPNRFSLHPAWRLNDDRQIGLRSWQAFEFEAVQLRMLSGEINPTRPQAAPPASTSTNQG